MPPLRGLLASLGASVSLVAAGALGLLAISAVIVLEGWPGIGGGFGDRPLSLGQLTAPGSEPGEPRGDGPVLLAQPAPEDDASPAAEESGAVAGSAAEGPAFSRGSTLPSLPPRRPRTGGRPLPPPPPPDRDVSSDSDAGSGDEGLLELEEPLCALTEVSDGVLSGTGQVLSPVTDALLPGSGQTVEGVTDGLGDGVESTACSLGSTVDHLLGGSP